MGWANNTIISTKNQPSSEHCPAGFRYSSITSNIILVPNLKPFWKIKQSVVIWCSRRHLYSERTVLSARLSWWLKAFPHSGKSAPTISCTLYKRMCHTLLAQYCRTRILHGFSYCILLVDQFLEDDFLCTVADVVHGSDPCQLLLRLQALVDAFFLCHSCVTSRSSLFRAWVSMSAR